MEHDHPLSEAMAAHDHTDHDLLVVQMNIDALARRYRRRLLIQRSIAGVVIGAGLLAGACYFYRRHGASRGDAAGSRSCLPDLLGK